MGNEHEWLTGFPQNLVTQRERASFTKAELAARVEVTEGSVEAWKAGTALPSLPEFLRLAEIFGWPIPRAIVEERLTD